MEVTVGDIASAREERAARQHQLLSQYGKTLISFSMNIPGPEKDNDLIRRGMSLGQRRLEQSLCAAGIVPEYRERRDAFTGGECFYVLPCSGETAKSITVEIEESDEAGRLFDMDVLTADGGRVDRLSLGLPGRKCLLCGRDAFLCACSRTHSAAELQRRAFSILEDALRNDKAETVAELACRALLYEALTTPKPGLVDCNNTGALAAVGGCFENMLRCTAVSGKHRGEGLLSRVISHLITVEAARGHTRLFVHTKPDAAVFFRDLGFYEIAGTGNAVFMENRKNGFEEYLAALERPAEPAGEAAAIVMNANPFTLGHQYLAETAAARYETVHLFVVSEVNGPIPAAVRKQLVAAGTAHIPNVIVHDCGPYMISYAVFPGYFLKEKGETVTTQAELDLQVFVRIAGELNITCRYVGEEDESTVTGVYNRVMLRELNASGIRCEILPRKTARGEVISASAARRALAQGDAARFGLLVPETTREWFDRPEAVPVIERLRAE